MVVGLATPPYDGPLDAGAAVGALECEGETPYERGESVYDDGLATVQASAEAPDITFLLVGREERADWYVRDAGGGDFSELLRTTFANEATLPEAATDTGLRRDGRQLWIGPDEEAAYLVALADAQDVERCRRPNSPSAAA